jgi:hypothetical protein
VLFVPQVHVPSAQVPSQWGFCPSHVTWHGGAPHEKEHTAPVWHVHSPLAHVPLQVDCAPQLT